jgi:hypothetical protein
MPFFGQFVFVSVIFNQKKDPLYAREPPCKGLIFSYLLRSLYTFCNQLPTKYEATNRKIKKPQSCCVPFSKGCESGMLLKILFVTNINYYTNLHTELGTAKAYYKTPLVLGKLSMALGSRFTAIFMAFAQALNIASILWCSLSPSTFMFRLHLAVSVKLLKKW